MIFLASLAGETRRITLGTAVVNLPYTRPVIAASNAAMLDNLLQGRFIFGVGQGILRSDAEALEMPESERHAPFAEAIDHVIRLWTGEAPYGIEGRFRNISTAKTQWPKVGLGSIVAPYSEPHPRDTRHRLGPEFADDRRAWPTRVACGVVEFAAPQLAAKPLDQL